MARETFEATFKSSVLKIDLKTLKKITMPTELMITIGTITIFTISTAASNGRVRSRIRTIWIISEMNVTPSRNVFEYWRFSFFFQPIKEPMIPWMIAESTQATVEILSGKIRYRWAAAITVVIKPETGPPRNPADRTPITRAFGSAPVTWIPM